MVTPLGMPCNRLCNRLTSEPRANGPPISMPIYRYLCLLMAMNLQIASKGPIRLVVACDQVAAPTPLIPRDHARMGALWL